MAQVVVWDVAVGAGREDHAAAGQAIVLIGGDWPALYASASDLDESRANGGTESAVSDVRPMVPRLPVIPRSGEGVADGEWIEGKASHYGESYNGQPLGCGGGSYRSSDDSIVAVAPDRYGEWPCGTVFELCGSVGCIYAVRQDACPGCSRNHLDLSEAGVAAVCGAEVGTCAIRFRVVEESVTP
mgnify:CR=1 FL=1